MKLDKEVSINFCVCDCSVENLVHILCFISCQLAINYENVLQTGQGFDLYWRKLLHIPSLQSVFCIAGLSNMVMSIFTNVFVTDVSECGVTDGI